jgi:hypothetical protein
MLAPLAEQNQPNRPALYGDGAPSHRSNARRDPNGRVTATFESRLEDGVSSSSDRPSRRPSD